MSVPFLGLTWRILWHHGCHYKYFQPSVKCKIKHARRVHSVARKPAAGQRLQKKQIYKSRYWVTVSQTNIFPRQQLIYNNRSVIFCKVRVPRSYKKNKLGAVVSWVGVNQKSRMLVWDGHQPESSLWDICQSVRMYAENIVRIRYQETASENELRILSMCCSEKASAWISDSVIITCNYHL
jgi:hypothetical protein